MIVYLLGHNSTIIQHKMKILFKNIYFYSLFSHFTLAIHFSFIYYIRKNDIHDAMVKRIFRITNHLFTNLILISETISVSK